VRNSRLTHFEDAKILKGLKCTCKAH